MAMLALHNTQAFTTPSSAARTFGISKTSTVPRPMATQIMSQLSREDQEKEDQEIERLKAMAQQLRAEAAALEAERANELAQAAESAFRKFDLNDDGVITLDELKAGLEKNLKTELPEKRVAQLLKDFDTSGDGVLQLDEFASVEKFRNKLEALANEEKRLALEAKKAAQKEAEMSKLIEAQMSMLNEGEPTTADKFWSVLPYLFPLLDSLQFGRFLIMENPENPFVVALALLFTVYKSIPFSGFAAFLALNFLSSNFRINRLIRFNMQQAIFLDIALFFPSLAGAILGVIASGAGVQLPPSFTELGSDVIFGTLLLTVAYASISSLLGQTPNKIPGISQAVEDRMPSFDNFDASGQFIPRNQREEKKDDEEQKKD
jgi:Ca2+-binding EF-hand superfamily protein